MAESTSSPQSVIGAVTLALLVAGASALAIGQGGALVLGAPVTAWCVAFAFLVQWIAFIPAYRLRTEHFYDLVGSGTYVSTVALAVALSDRWHLRGLIVAALVMVWAGRLGTFLFRRIRRSGRDSRFDEIKADGGKFFTAWTLQGLWVSLTLSAALAVITAPARAELGVVEVLGLGVWLAGFTIEVVADRQKKRFRDRPANRNRFIDSGLWSRSRHPNYLGEITLWLGVAIVATPTLDGWRWVAWISPVFVFLLLRFGSGVPPLERKARQKWGGDPDYERYVAETPILFPRLFR